jgi:hypothetical protein
MSFLHARPCEACKAQQQTITVLADQIDWLREQLAKAGRVQPFVQPASAFERMNVSEDEEDLMADMAAGRIDISAAEEALAQLQTANQSIELVSA